MGGEVPCEEVVVRGGVDLVETGIRRVGANAGHLAGITERVTKGKRITGDENKGTEKDMTLTGEKKHWRRLYHSA